ncbi:threonine/homoserine exporter RhtA [Ectopseudomonas hydrolytica]|uniref:EamA domain-containing protein n=1 Tax=Ectopseudomonas mendocina (strain ymp) TaxID=399739 RepID=A4XVA4_ECTM1|nr:MULTISPECIES: threonine/homoserine exporter RhtA [Pseudomonas]ARS48743.1 transporter [Pseudomonas mendocina]ATH82450.1 threonine/homoserine exporter RhtA [Pseudomonas mendocina]MBF8160686.1 threonine/homoserine exporter RhtA [Pseudomonas mendocina]UTH33692.1 threonine/homoserine exporter RhtA [Pseudomonas hydrolytica]UTH38511.1 threonine/homoserine exporter RhtA [Pseudomonas sp. KHPS1]
MPRTALLAPIGLLLVAMISIQSGASLAKSLFPLVGAEGTTALRLVLGATILSLVMQPWRTRLNLAAYRSLLAYGLALGGMNLLFYMSLQSIPLGIAVALEFTGPLGLALLSSRRLLDFVWVALAVFGLWLLLPSGLAQTQLDPLGMALALAAGLCWALYIVFGQKAGAAHGRQTVALGTWVAALLVLPIGLWQAGGSLFSVDLLPIALGVAVLSSALPYSLEMVALTRLPARTFSILMSLEPAIAALSGLLFLSEKLSWNQWLAIGAIILASAGAAATIRPKS